MESRMAQGMVDRYVREAVDLLPRRVRAEAEEDLRGRIRDRLRDRSRAGVEDPEGEERIATEVLRELGPPEVVATKLRPGRDWLIAPHLVRPFVTAVTISLSALVVVTVAELLTGPGGLSGEEGGPVDLLLRFVAELDDLVLKALLVLALLVGYFVFLDRTVEGEEAVRRRWAEKSLVRKDPERVSRGGAVLEIALAGVALMILHGTSFELGSVVSVDGESVWVPFRIPAVRAHLPWMDLWLVGTIVLDGVLLWRGRWSALTHAADAGLSLLLAWVLWRVQSAVPLMSLDPEWMAANGWSAEAIERAREAFEGPLQEVLRMALAGVVAVCLVVAGLEVFRAVRAAWREASRDPEGGVC